jgi:hypothetical protein
MGSQASQAFQQQRADSREQRAQSREQLLAFKHNFQESLLIRKMGSQASQAFQQQRADSKEQRAQSREQRAAPGLQKAISK